MLIAAGPAPTPSAMFGPSINSRMKFFWFCLLFNLALLLLLGIELLASLGKPLFSGDRFVVLIGLMTVVGLLSLGSLLLEGLKLGRRNRLLVAVPLALLEIYGGFGARADGTGVGWALKPLFLEASSLGWVLN